LKFEKVNYEGSSSEPNISEDVFFRSIAEDAYIPGNYLVSKGFALYTTKDLNDTTLIAGRLLDMGYQEGIGDNAKFGEILGIVASPTSRQSTWIADFTNNCIRWIDRKTNKVSHLTGMCENDESKDGNFDDARLNTPLELVAVTSSKIYFTGGQEYTIKCLCSEDNVWKVKTLYNFQKRIIGFALNPSQSLVYILHRSGVGIINKWFNAKSYRVILNDYRYHSDGRLEAASVNFVSGIYFFDDYNFLLAESYLHDLRVVQLRKNRISSICVLQSPELPEKLSSGRINQCRIRFPRKFARVAEDSNKIRIIGLRNHYSLEFGKYSKNI